MAEELAVAYLSLVPSLKGAGAEISRQLTGSEVTAATAGAGRKLGGTLGAGLAAGAKPGLTAMAGSLATAAAGGAILKQLSDTANAYQQAGREALKFQRVTGSSAEDASRLRVVAQQTGLDVDKLSTAFVRLSRTADTTQGQQALSKLGVSLKDANGEALPLLDQLRALASGFAASDDAATKNAAAMALFGRSGADLLPLLNRGAQGIDALVAKADELGLTLNQEDLDGVKEYIGAQRDLALAQEGFKLQVGREVFPVITQGLLTAANAAKTLGGAFSVLPDSLKTIGVVVTGLAAGGAVLFGGGGILIAGTRLAATQWSLLAASISSAGVSAAAATPQLAGATTAATPGRFGGVGATLGKASGYVAAGLALYEVAQLLERATTNTTKFDAALGRLNKGGDPLQSLQSSVDALYGSTERYRDIANGTYNFATFGAFDLDTPTIQLGKYRAAIEDVDRAIRKTAETDPTAAVAYIDSALKAASNPEGFRGDSRFDDLKTDLGTLRQELIDAGVDEAEAAAAAEGLAASTDVAAASTTMFSGALTKLQGRLRFAASGMELAESRADAFGKSLDGASFGDDILASSVTLGQGIRDFAQGLRPADEATDEFADSTDLAAEAQTRLRDALEETNPNLRAMQVNLDANAAAGDAFAKSISEGFAGATVSSAIDLGDAFGDFRRTVHQLPKDIDLAGAALNKYGKLQDEGIRNMLQLGAATREYLANLLKQGDATSDVRAEAGRLREAYRQQLAALGLNEAQMEEYLKLLGVTPKQVDTAITLSQVEKSRFKLNAYLGLLDGKIPAEITSQVTAQIEAGDLEGASNTLARFAATNPVRLDTKVNEPSQSDLKKVKDSIEFALPANIDLGKVLTGQYSDQQLAGIAKAQDLTKAAAASLESLVKSGAGQGEVLAQAKTLRDALGQVFTEAGASKEAVDKLFTDAGLQDQQIELAIQVSGEAEALAKLQLLNDMLGEDGQPTPGVQRDIAYKISVGNYQGAADILSRWYIDTQDGVLNDPLIANLSIGDLGLPDSQLQAFVDAQGNTVIRLKTEVETPVVPPPSEWSFFGGTPGGSAEVPVGANTTQATADVTQWHTNLKPSDIPMGANTTPATNDVGAFKAAQIAAPPIQVPATLKVSLDDGSWRNVLGIITGAKPAITPRYPGANGKGGWDKNFLTPFADGGLREEHVAQIARGGDWRLWAEPETGGEAYIPLGGSKRGKSTEILAEVARQFGFSLMPKAAMFADGGTTGPIGPVPVTVPQLAGLPSLPVADVAQGVGGGDHYTIAPVYQMAGAAPRAQDIPEIMRAEKFLRRKDQPTQTVQYR